MKRKSVYTCLVMLFMSLVLQAKDKDVAVAEALLKRLLPSYIESFQFQKLKGEKDCFTIESVKDKIVIGGNNANSMAMGLNHYLKYYCRNANTIDVTSCAICIRASSSLSIISS